MRIQRKILVQREPEGLTVARCTSLPYLTKHQVTYYFWPRGLYERCNHNSIVEAVSRYARGNKGPNTPVLSTPSFKGIYEHSKCLELLAQVSAAKEGIE